MKRLTDRPLLTVCAVFVAVTVFLVAGFVFVPFRAVLAGVLSCLFFLTGGLLLRRKKIAFPMTGLFLLSLGVCMGIGTGYVRNTLRYGHVTSYAGKTCQVTGTVLERDYDSSGFSSYTVRITEADGKKESFRVKLSARKELGCRYGDRISFSADFSLPEEMLQGFPLRRYDAGKGIYLTAEARERVRIEKGKKTLLTVLHTFSDKTAARARLMFGRDLGGLCSGILLGRRDDIPESVRRDFSWLGISHVLAVSGMHLSVLVGGLFLLLKWLRWHRSAVLAVTSLFTLTFMALTGFSPSVVRAGIMMLVMLLAYYIGRNEDLLIALFFSCAVLLLFSPDSAADAGFLLSFSSALGLITLGRALSADILTGKQEKKPSLLRRMGSALLAPAAVTASAILFTLPVTCLYFGSLSTVGILSNLLFVPLLTLLLYGAVFALIGYYPAVLLTKGLGKGILYGVGKCAALLPPPVRLDTDGTRIAAAAALLSLLAAGLLYRRFRNAGRLTVLFLVPLVVWGGTFALCRLHYRRETAERVTVSCLTLKENEYIGVQSGRFFLLCEISDGSRRNLTYAAELFGETLREVSPDALLLTHLHTDHIRTFSLFADGYRLRTLYLPSRVSGGEENALAGLLREADRRGIAVVRYDPEAPLSFDGFSLTAGAPRYIDRSVQPMLSLRIDTGRDTFVYLSRVLAEAGSSAYAAWFAADAGILWLGAHGPKLSGAYQPVFPFSGQLLLSDGELPLPQTETEFFCLTEGVVHTCVLSDG